MTQFCIEEAIVLRYRTDQMSREKEAEDKEALDRRLVEIASRQGKRV